jgi:hypothetical protein
MVADLPRLRFSGVVASRPMELRVSPVAMAIYCLSVTPKREDAAGCVGTPCPRARAPPWKRRPAGPPLKEKRRIAGSASGDYSPAPRPVEKGSRGSVSIAPPHECTGGGTRDRLPPATACVRDGSPPGPKPPLAGSVHDSPARRGRQEDCGVENRSSSRITALFGNCIQ